MGVEKQNESNAYESDIVKARRYRTSKYFLDDQLKCSEAIHDFQSVKALVNSLPQFSLKGRLEFATETVRSDD